MIGRLIGRYSVRLILISGPRNKEAMVYLRVVRILCLPYRYRS